jgi:hypothetical protein
VDRAIKTMYENEAASTVTSASTTSSASAEPTTISKPPKRARDPYFIRSEENRAKIKRKMGGRPQKSAVELELGRQWQALSPEDKKIFEEQSAKEKAA